MNTRLIMDHKPRMGGTYVLSVLGQRYRDHYRCGWHSEFRPSRALACGLLSSHWAFQPPHDMAHHGLTFTWLRNPADVAYSAWYFFSTVAPESWPHEGRWEFYLLRHVRSAETLKGYINACLDDPAPFYPETMYSFDGSAYDFVGTVAHTARDLHTLAWKAGLGRISIVNGTRRNAAKGREDYTYRRAELEERLAPEFKTYRSYL